ncbi:MAG: FliH/SctL family protein [bacterium]|nr:FliH/SctL family protein [bacterium]
MNKVIRTARISTQRVRLGVASGKEREAAAAEAELEFTRLDEQIEAMDPSESADEAIDGTDAEMQDGDSDEQEAIEDGTAMEDLPSEVWEGEKTEEPPEISAIQVETLVEERLKEFEQRFQQEKEDAYRSGFEDGKTEGLKEGQEQSRDEIDRFVSALQSLQEQWEDHYKNTDQDLTHLALAVARRIIGASVQIQEEPVLHAVQECLAYLQDKSRVVIKVNPQDLDVVRRHRNNWLESLEGIEKLLVEGDADISRGGCIVETPKGDVDAQVEERLERLQTLLWLSDRTGDKDESE